ncbi:MAG: ABC transporter permease [Thermoanaerobaculia bacterium]
MFLYYLRLAAKSALATPGLTLLTVGAIALGVAVPTALISVHHVFAQNPIPEKSARLFNVRVDNWELASEAFNLEPGDPPKHITYRDMRGLMASDIPKGETGVAGARAFVFPEGKDARPYQTVIQLVHADFFPMFNAPFRFGNGWAHTADESRQHVVVLSADANERVFGGADSVGKSIRIGPQTFTIVGVLAPWQPTPLFYDVINNNNGMGKTREYFMPFDLIRDASLALKRTGDSDGFGNSNNDDPDAFFDASENNWIQYWVELDPGKRADYVHFVDAYAQEQKNAGRFPRPLNNRVTPLMEWMRVRRVVPPATVGLVVIALLFLAICCLNLTGLLLGKFLSRSGVLGVHRALGAPRSAIFLQRLLECELVGVAGGLSGMLLAAGALKLINAMLPPNVARAGLFGADGFTILVAIGLALAAGLLSGLYPAWRACRIPPAMQLKLQ